MTHVVAFLFHFPNFFLGMYGCLFVLDELDATHR